MPKKKPSLKSELKREYKKDVKPKIKRVKETLTEYKKVINTNPIAKTISKINPKKIINKPRREINKIINTPKRAIKSVIKKGVTDLVKGNVGKDRNWEKIVRDLKKERRDLQNIINKLQGQNTDLLGKLAKTKRVLSPEQKLYYSLNAKVKRRLNKVDKQSDILSEISEVIGFDSFKLNENFFGGSVTRAENLKLRLDKSKSYQEKIKLLESQINRLNKNFEELGNIRGDVFSTDFKQNILKAVGLMVYWDSDQEVQIDDKDSGMDMLGKLKDYLGMSDQEAYEVWSPLFKNNQGVVKEEIAFTFDEFLEFIALV